MKGKVEENPPAPLSYYLIFYWICEEVFLENLDISEKIAETL